MCDIEKKELVPSETDSFLQNGDVREDEEDGARKWITELTEKDGNNACADCGEKRELISNVCYL